MLLKIASPDVQVEVFFSLNREKVPIYSVNYEGEIIVAESPLAIRFKQGGLLSKNLKITDVKYNNYDETYELVVGKSKQARNHCNELVISLQEKESPKRRLDLVFRVYDDGVAFRYILPKQKPLKEFEILAEKSEFHFPENHACWILPLGSFTTNYEKEFDKVHLSDIKPDTILGLPLVIEAENGPTLALAEANLTDYAGMYLSGVKGSKLALVSRLSPLPDSDDICVKASSPHKSPWRVIMIGDKPGDLVESNIVLNLNKPCVIEDSSWIKPGKVAWPWWNGRIVTGVNFEGGMNTKTMFYFIDFASKNNLEYLLIDAGWYGNEEEAVSNPSKFDITKTIQEIDLPKIVSYGNKKDVDIILWLHWWNANEQMDKAFPLYRQWGVKGVKIDFMDRDDQEMVNFYHRTMKKASKNHLLVDFHGAYKPTGLRRTYPNLITREGILGLEHNKWSDRVTPQHNVTIPFTRMLAGPMDYTPGAFHNVTRKQFKPQYKAPMAMGTRCHHLAMFVVYESPLQMVSDHPGAYWGQVGLDFLQIVPASWDETKVLAGKIGDYIAITRKHGRDWFIGAMTNWDRRLLNLPLGFLKEGDYSVTIYADGPGANRNAICVSVTKRKVRAKTVLRAEMAPGGGFVAHLTPVK